MKFLTWLVILVVLDEALSSIPDRCRMARDAGTCIGYTSVFYYNKYIRRCLPFVYGGCDGNQNRFSTRALCEQICMNKREADCLDPEPMACESGVTGYYYKKSEQKCVDGLSICTTNTTTTLNKFKTLEECQSKCGFESYNSNLCYANNQAYVFGQVFNKTDCLSCKCHYGTVVCDNLCR